MNRLLQQERPNQLYIKYILSAIAAEITGSLAGNKCSDDNKNKNKHLLVAYQKKKKKKKKNFYLDIELTSITESGLFKFVLLCHLLSYRYDADLVGGSSDITK